MNEKIRLALLIAIVTIFAACGEDANNSTCESDGTCENEPQTTVCEDDELKWRESFVSDDPSNSSGTRGSGCLPQPVACEIQANPSSDDADVIVNSSQQCDCLIEYVQTEVSRLEGDDCFCNNLNQEINCGEQG